MASLTISHQIQTCQVVPDAGQTVLELCQLLEVQLMLQCMAIRCMEHHLLHRHHMWMLSHPLLTQLMKRRATSPSTNTTLFSSRRPSRAWTLQLLTSSKGLNYSIHVTGDKR